MINQNLSIYNKRTKNERDELLQIFSISSLISIRYQFMFLGLLIITAAFSFTMTSIDFLYAISCNETKIPRKFGNYMYYVYAFDSFHLIDVFLDVLHHKIDPPELKNVHKKTPIWLTTIRLCALLPTDSVYWIFLKSEMIVVYGLRLRYFLRILTIFEYIKRKKETTSSFHLYSFDVMVQYITILIILCVICMYILYYQYCIDIKGGCEFRMVSLMNICFQHANTPLIYRGFFHHKIIFSSSEYILTFISYICYLFLYGYIVGEVTVGIYILKSRKYLYTEMVRKLLNSMRRYGTDKNRIKTLCNVFEIYWMKRKNAELYPEFKKKLPDGIVSDLILEVSWQSLKHSQLFRDQDVHFLRYVSSLMNHWFYVPGQIVFKKGLWKSKMVYLVSGVIQILSEEDGETPVLNLSRGTVIGESTLLQSYPSSCNVICLTYCIVHVLEKRNFLKVISKYPQEFQKLSSRIKKRYMDGEIFKKISDFRSQKMDYKISHLSLNYIKMAVLRLSNNTDMTDMTFEEIHDYEVRKKNEKLRAVTFCPKYLDLITIANEYEMKFDTSFIKITFPYIMRPDSFLCLVWNKFVAVLALGLALTYPYFLGFNEKSTDYICFLYIVTFFWILDIYISLNTAILSSNIFFTKWSDILWANLFSLSFWIDIFSIFPMEIFVVSQFKISRQTFMLFMSNRLLKLRKIYILFSSIYYDFLYLKIIVYYVIFLLTNASFLFLFECLNKKCLKGTIPNLIKKFKDQEFHASIFFGTQLTTGFSFSIIREESVGNSGYFFIVLRIFSIIFFLYCQCDLICYYIFYFSDFVKINSLIEMVSSILNKLNVSKRNVDRVIRYYQGHWKLNEARWILHDKAIIPQLPKELYTYHKYKISTFIYLMPVLKDLPEKLLIDLCFYFTVEIFNPYEVIVYQGEICQNAYFIVNGYCECSDGHTDRLLKPQDSFAVLDCCFQFPSSVSVYSLTHVVTATILFKDFQTVCSKFPEQFEWLKKMKTSLENQRNIQKFNRIDVNISKTGKLDNEKHVFVNIKRNTKEDSKEWTEYYTSFKKRYVFSLLHIILLRTTFACDGRVVFVWEIFRIIFALLTAFVVIIPYCGYCSDCHLWYILLILDLLAWIDIYFRQHVTYFNSLNIEVIHPLYTALNYYCHAFATDLFAVFPFNAIIFAFADNTLYNKLHQFHKMNRIFQLYRIFNFFQLYEVKGKASKWAILKLVPFFILFIYLLSFFVTDIACEFATNSTALETFYCHPTSWLMKSEFRKPFTISKIFLYSSLYITSSLTGIGVGGFTCDNVTDCTLIWLPNFVGFLFWLFYSSIFCAIHLNANFQETFYQGQAQNFIHFMKFHKIHKHVKDEVIHHFELVWLRNRGQDIQSVAENLHFSLIGDVLLDINLSKLSQSVFFANADTSFLRNLLTKTRYEIYLNRGIISRVNDIQSNIFITLDENVEVLGPDGNRLLMLPIGSLFGNLDKCEKSRMTLTVVAKGHTEVLSIPSLEFHENLVPFGKLHVDFLRRTAIHVDYVAGGPIRPFRRDELEGESKTKFFFQINPDGKFLLYWEIFLSLTICFLCIPLETFHLTVGNYNIAFAICVSLLDIIYIFNIFVKFHTCYEEKSGIAVTDKTKITQRYLKSPFGFAIDLVAVLPFEIICLFFIQKDYIWNVWSFTRVNRFIKFYFVIEMLNKKRQKLSVSFVLINMLYILVWMEIYVMLMTILIANISCIFPNDNFSILYFKEQPYSFTCDWIENPILERLKIFLDFFRIVMNCLTGYAIPNVIPNHEVMIIATIILLVVSRLVWILFVSAGVSILFAKSLTFFEFAKNAENVKIFMAREQVSIGIKNHIWNYLNLLWKNNRGELMPSFMNKIPFYLKEAVLNSIFGYHLQSHPILGRFHLDLLRQIAVLLQIQTYFPGDYITFVNDVDEKMYFIHEGIVEVLSKDSYTVTRIKKELVEGEMFGLEQGLNPYKGHEYTYRAKVYSVILKLEHKQWFHMLEFFPASKLILKNFGFME